MRQDHNVTWNNVTEQKTEQCHRIILFQNNVTQTRTTQINVTKVVFMVAIFRRGKYSALFVQDLVTLIKAINNVLYG